jgi:transposase
MKATTVGIDLAKNEFRLHGVDWPGRVVLKNQVKREQMVTFLANLAPALVGMEACSGSQYWAQAARHGSHRKANSSAIRQTLSVRILRWFCLEGDHNAFSISIFCRPIECII